MSVYDRFNRLLQGRAPMPQANIMRPYQTPQGMTPPMALPRPTPPQSPMLANQQLSPLMQEVVRRAQASRMTPRAGQVGLPTPATAAAGQPAPEMTFGQKLMQPRAQGMLGAAAAGFEASGYQDRPVSLGQVLGRMGTAGTKAYAAAEDRIAAQKAGQLTELLTRAKIGTELAKSGQGFSGTSMEAQSFNVLLKVGPKIEDGTATNSEKAQYSLAHGRLAKPQPIPTYDELGNQTITVVPAQDLSMFPEPPGGTGRIGTSTTKPSTEALKQQKYVKSIGSMADNINRYRQQLQKLSFVDMASGTADFPTDNMSRASAIAESLRLDIKELEELGALVGGDFQILDNLLTSPNSAKAIKAGSSALLIQLDELENTVGQKLSERGATLSGTYSTPITTNTKEDWDKVRVGQYAVLPDGTIKMKVRPQ